MQLGERQLRVLERLLEGLLVVADPVAETLHDPETPVGLALVTRPRREIMSQRCEPQGVVVVQPPTFGGRFFDRRRWITAGGIETGLEPSR